MSRNFNNGSRDPTKAGGNALRDACDRGEISEKTVVTYRQAFSQFAQYAKDTANENLMEKMTSETLIAYGQELAEKVDAGELSPSTAQNLVSAAQRTLEIASRGEKSLNVSPTKDCNIQQRCAVRDVPTLGQERAAEGISALREAGLTIQFSISEVARDFGLRAKEASLFDAKSALSEAESRGAVSISDGTKGGRDREVHITSERQLETLRNAAQEQGNRRALMPTNENWKTWLNGGLREGREMLKEVTGGGYHEMRSEYAAARYEQLTGHAAPCNGGNAPSEVDKAAREQITRELGHGRISVVSEYIGCRT